MVSDRTKRFRGSRTHGRGKKAGRGAGLRGGRGMAGGHKHKWLHIVKYEPEHFGRYGFKKPPETVIKKKVINVGEITERFPGMSEIDLTSAGYHKLLGGGTISVPLTVRVSESSEKARNKIESAGGKIIEG